MKVKVGDTVKVIAGADKGKTGKVIKTLKTEARVVVEGVHIVKNIVNQQVWMTKVEYLKLKPLYMFLM